VRDAIDEHCWRGAGVSAAIEYESRINFDDLAVCVCVMSHEDGGRMAMHMTEEAFFSAVLHLDRTSSLQREQTAVHLKADVFACAERTSNATECEPNLVCGQIEASRYLCEVFMQPLSGNM
jgi:hypothetical protein